MIDLCYIEISLKNTKRRTIRMKFRKLLTITLAALLVISLSACGAATDAPMSNGGSDGYYNRYEKDTALEAPELSDSASTATSSTQLPQNQKLVQ